LKYFKIIILFLSLILIVDCTRQKSKIDINLCNKTSNEIKDISLTYNKNINTLNILHPDLCTKIRLTNIISESGLYIKYFQKNKYITHDINIYFEEFSYKGIITILITENNLKVTNNIEIVE